MYMYTHTHAHAHTYVYTHTHIHTRIHTNIHKHTHVHTHVHTTNKYNRQQTFKHTDTYTSAQRHINLLVTCSNLSCSRKVNRESGNSLRYCFNKLATTLASQLDKSTTSPVDNTQPIVKLCYCHNIHKKGSMTCIYMYMHNEKWFAQLNRLELPFNHGYKITTLCDVSTLTLL